MSTIAEELKEHFDNIYLADTIARLDGTAVGFGESPNYMIVENFKNAKATVEESIQKGLFLTIPHARRIAMRDAMRSATTNHGSSQSVLQSLDNFADAVDISGLAAKLTPIDTKKYLSEFRKLNERSKELENAIQNNALLVDGIKDAARRSSAFLKLQERILSHLDHNKNVIESTVADINEHQKQSSDIVTSVKENEKEIETRRLSIETFATNISEYKETIDEIQKKAEAVVNRSGEIDHLIEEAQIALQLTSAEGVSAAFAAHHRKASDRTTLGLWIIACFACLGTALWFTITLISEKHLAASKDKISPLLLAYPWLIIVGRAVAVSICLSAAAFCARQYTKQKQLAEDYGYKSVLAKSIVAFTQEIKKSDDSKVAEYLTTVLTEIHRDPLRNKLTKNDSLSLIDIKTLIESIVEKSSKKAE